MNVVEAQPTNGQELNSNKVMSGASSRFKGSSQEHSASVRGLSNVPETSKD